MILHLFRCWESCTARHQMGLQSVHSMLCGSLPRLGLLSFYRNFLKQFYSFLLSNKKVEGRSQNLLPHFQIQTRTRGWCNHWYGTGSACRPQHCSSLATFIPWPRRTCGSAQAWKQSYKRNTWAAKWAQHRPAASQVSCGVLVHSSLLDGITRAPAHTRGRSRCAQQAPAAPPSCKSLNPVYFSALLENSSGHWKKPPKGNQHLLHLFKLVAPTIKIKFHIHRKP